jgi:hypothetical protein
MDLAEIAAELATWRQQPALYAEAQLALRARALDFLYFVRDVLPATEAPGAALSGLVDDAATLAAELTAINTMLFQRTRTAIQQRHLTGATLRTYFDQIVSYDEEANDDGVYTSYGGLDVLIDGIFALHDAPTPTLPLAAEMVHCEETPALVILDLVNQIDFGPNDVFYDLGSGLGQVAMLVHLLTGVAARGVEIEPAFVAFARQQAAALGVAGVEFMEGDAQTVDYRDGTVFFLFTPFRGALLQRVLSQLQQAAQHHPIQLCTFGPCTPAVAETPWLHTLTAGASHQYRLTIFESR